jgi:outer membrane protein
MLLLMTLSLLAGGAHAQQTKIGYVDWKRLVESAPQIQIARDKLDAEFRPRNETIEADEAILREMEQRHQRDIAVMGLTEAQALERQIRSLRRTVQRDKEDLAEELDYRLTEERQQVEDEIYKIIMVFAKEDGYDLILPGPMLYVNEEINLTDKLLVRMRAAYTRPKED